MASDGEGEGERPLVLSAVPAPPAARQGLPSASTDHTRHVYDVRVGPLSSAWATAFNEMVATHELLPALARAWGVREGAQQLSKRDAHTRAMHLLSLVERAITPDCWTTRADRLPPAAVGGLQHPLLAPLACAHDNRAVCMPAVAPAPGGTSVFKPHARGYVQVHLGGGVLEYAHRIVTWLFLGAPDPPTRQSVHLCGHPNCLNPFHLTWAWPATNSAMAAWHAQPGHRGHAYPFIDSRELHADEFEGAQATHAALMPGRERQGRKQKRARGRPRKEG